MAFKEALKDLRTSRKLTQAELAQAIGISQTAISLYERGEREPDMQLLTKFAQLFSVDMNFLLGTEAKPAPVHTEQTELNVRDQRDIGKKMRSMLELFDSNEALMFDGEPLDDETRELLRISYQNQLELTKRIAKPKYRSKKKKA